MNSSECKKKEKSPSSLQSSCNDLSSPKQCIRIQLFHILIRTWHVCVCVCESYVFITYTHTHTHMHTLTSGKEPACQCRRLKSLIPGSGRSPGGGQPTPVFLPRESHGQRSPAGCSSWGHKESSTTEATQHVSTCNSSGTSGISSLKCFNLHFHDGQRHQQLSCEHLVFHILFPDVFHVFCSCSN